MIQSYRGGLLMVYGREVVEWLFPKISTSLSLYQRSYKCNVDSGPHKLVIPLFGCLLN